ncbi:S41 family peptidase [Sediminicola luteus]|uniref:Carboxyl-terminal protease n=1 Tax=Sediminicola luteus TaxID=319238 RepID=A0A2A4G375_9FLAO|nr:S41 family peptidase [Sediminicola luteus]PCE62438.1 carboxyl-terminal protease [Sediminicola luteus]
MKKMMLWGILLVALIGCSSSDDSLPPAPPSPPVAADVNAQNFMWRAMNLWYFWQGDVAALADGKNQEDNYESFLDSYENAEAFFYNICNKHENVVGSDAAIDRFSFAAEDYRDLVNSLAGVSKSNGVEFGLTLIGDSNNVLGYVQYILPNSDASNKDVQRGEFFTRVNGQTLTIDNYIQLLFGENDTYTLGFATITDGIVSDIEKEVSLTKTEFTENPVYLHKVIESGGNKIGYLMYNRFLRDFDDELNEVFATFKAEGVTDLVLDLRYNPGGAVSSAIALSSMIYGTETEKLFIKQRWNNKIQNELTEAQLTDNFVATTTSGTAINTLNLSKVYILATSGSASASELVINGLAPYLDVTQIGTKTRGKNEFSITFVDDPANSFIYNPDRVGSINADVQWGLQPLCGRNENADGFSDYTTGLVPDVEFREDILNLGVLGETDEPFLAKALEQINGGVTKGVNTPLMPVEAFTSSNLNRGTKDKAILTKNIL